jgi:predicted metal-dependent hydrolase
MGVPDMPLHEDSSQALEVLDVRTDRVLVQDGRLIQAPAAAMEYVVAHEVCHLAERHHGPAFWAKLGEAMPDWNERKAALEGWENEHLVV